MRAAYVQKHPDGRFLNANGFTAFERSRALGYDMRTFVSGDLDTLSLSPESVVVGHIKTVWRALAKLGVPQPPYLLTPERLKPFLGRDEWTTTLGKVRRLEQVSVSIKPLERGNAFSGHVVSAFRDLLETSAWPDDLPLLAQTPITFKSEWRAFMLKGGVLGVGHYYGDPLRFPDAAVVRAMLNAYAAAPVGYALDIGVTEAGENLLVELNDGYALGCYGLPAHLYVRLLEARWDELSAARFEAA